MSKSRAAWIFRTYVGIGGALAISGFIAWEVDRASDLSRALLNTAGVYAVIGFILAIYLSIYFARKS